MRTTGGTASSDDALSTLALQIVETASKPDCTITELARLAEQDPGFAARLLHLVNSPVNGISRRVSDVRQATSLLGVAALQNIALALAVTDLVPIGTAGETLLAVGLRRACAARRIAEITGFANHGEAFTTGLMLEVGFLRLARHDLEAAARLAHRPALSRPTQERIDGHIPHPLTGSHLARKWHLPDPMVDAIAHHHDDKPMPQPLARIAWAAERVAAVFEGGEVDGLRSGAVRAMVSIGAKPPDAEAMLKDLPALVREAGQAFQRKVGKQVELEKVLSDANLRLVELNKNYQDLLASMELMLKDKEKLVAELQRANADLERLAATDGLTGIHNRRAFLDVLRRDIARARRNGSKLSVLLLDVDHFKKVNDTHGHQAGDAVLVAVAKTAVGTVRTADVVARYGGEEFVVLLSGTPREGALVVAERMRVSLQALKIEIGGVLIQITASFGLAELKPEDDPDLVLGRADAALYRAKETGRNRVVADG